MKYKYTDVEKLLFDMDSSLPKRKTSSDFIIHLTDNLGIYIHRLYDAQGHPAFDIKDAWLSPTAIKKLVSGMWPREKEKQQTFLDSLKEISVDENDTNQYKPGLTIRGRKNNHED